MKNILSELKTLVQQTPDYVGIGTIRGKNADGNCICETIMQTPSGAAQVIILQGDALVGDTVTYSNGKIQSKIKNETMRIYKIN